MESVASTLTEQAREWLPRTLVERMNIVLPPAGCGMFITSFVRTPAGAQLECDSPLLARDLEDHVFWALIARTARLGLTDFRHADGAHVKSLALNLVDGWHPTLRRMVGETDPSALVAIPLQSGDPPVEWDTSRVTLLGDAIHTMTPLQGLGGNTALRDAQLLCSQLVQVSGDQARVIPALHTYESEMRTYSSKAMRASLQQTRTFVSNNRVAREAFKVILRTATALPPLKQVMFRPDTPPSA